MGKGRWLAVCDRGVTLCLASFSPCSRKRDMHRRNASKKATWYKKESVVTVAGRWCITARELCCPPHLKGQALAACAVVGDVDVDNGKRVVHCDDCSSLGVQLGHAQRRGVCRGLCVMAGGG